MNPSMQRDDSELQRLRQAAQWLQQLQAAGQDERTVEAWLEWCQLDPRNQQAFDDLAAIWELGGALEPASDTAPRGRQIGRRWLLAAAAAVAVVTAGAGLWSLHRSQQDAGQTLHFASGNGVNRTEVLPDGSVLELGGQSAVTVTYRDNARHVELAHGELFVTVQRDSTRPFTVRAGLLHAFATGTAFNVQRQSDRTVVTVTEGTVEAGFQPAADSLFTPGVRLQRGQQLLYTESTRGFAVRWADPDTSTAWRSGTLRFVNEPLAQVIASVNRYAAHEILIQDPAIAALTFTGTARTDRIDNWLQALPAVFPVAVVELPDGRRLIGARRGR